jgi:hypothetical protein
MRRFFVICLTLLLPLNMFALAMAASAMQPVDATHHVATPERLSEPANASAVVFADSYLPGAYDCQTSCEIDPDEPPAGADIHDLVDEMVDLRPSFGPGRALAPGTLWRPSHSSVPLLKPPRAA